MSQQGHMMNGEVSQNARIWGLVSYGSHFLGLPLGIIPLIIADDPYAVHHAKHAVAVYLVTLAIGVAASVVITPLVFCTLGMSVFVLLPLLVLFAAWPLIHAIHGLILVLNGSWAEPIGTFGLGDRLFGGLRPSKPAANAEARYYTATTQPRGGAGSPASGDSAHQMTIDVPAEVSQR